MAETYTTNKSFAMVTPGTDPGTWGPFVNLNPALLDNMLGGTATIAVLNAPVILSSAQYQCAFLRFTGAITADVAITFPAVGSFYTIINDTTNSSAFCLTMATTAAGGRTIGIPPGSMTEVMTDGVNARFRGLPPVGTYWDYSGSSVPRWVNSCTIPPYLSCDGTVFSSVTYPHLANALGGTTLPDAPGRLRLALDGGAGRVSSAVSGVAGNTLLAGGGDQQFQSHNHTGGLTTGTDNPRVNFWWLQGSPAMTTGGNNNVVNAVGSSAGVFGVNQQVVQDTHTHSVTIPSTGAGNSQNMPPVYVGGITMVRAA